MLILTRQARRDLERAARSLGLAVRVTPQGQRIRGPYAGRSAYRVHLTAETLRARSRWGRRPGRGQVTPDAWLVYLAALYEPEPDLYVRSTAGTARTLAEAARLALAEPEDGDE